MYYNYGKKTLRDWMALKKEQVYNPNTIEYVRRLNQLHAEFKKVSAILFFLMDGCGMWADLRKMFDSVNKQKDFIYAVKCEVKEYGVDPDWEKTFEHDIDSMENREAYVFRITMDNIKLTEMYPFFVNGGFERLTEMANGDWKRCSEQIKQDLVKYMEEHPDEIAEHMESTRAEREARDRHRQKIADGKQAEKEAARLIKKLRKGEEREAKKNRKKRGRPRHYGKLKGL